MAKQRSAAHIQAALKAGTRDETIGLTVADSCRRHGITEQSYYRWRRHDARVPRDHWLTEDEIVHHEIREKMEESDVEILLQRARERHPHATHASSPTTDPVPRQNRTLVQDTQRRKHPRQGSPLARRRPLNRRRLHPPLQHCPTPLRHRLRHTPRQTRRQGSRNPRRKRPQTRRRPRYHVAPTSTSTSSRRS